MNVALVAEELWEPLVEDLSLEFAWDAIAIQELTPAREKGFRMVRGNLLLFGGAHIRRSTALLLHRRWLTKVKHFGGTNEIAWADVDVDGHLVRIMAAHLDPSCRSLDTVQNELERIQP